MICVCVLLLLAEYITLYNNSFTGKIPTGWNLRKLYYLDLGHNALSGSIPTDWYDPNTRDQMNFMSVLYLNHNRFSGEIAGNFSLIGKNRLSVLSINDNQFTGLLPGGFHERFLNILEAQNNRFVEMSMDICRNIVFNYGEMVMLRTDCEICSCTLFCSKPKWCYN